MTIIKAIQNLLDGNSVDEQIDILLTEVQFPLSQGWFVSPKNGNKIVLYLNLMLQIQRLADPKLAAAPEARRIAVEGAKAVKEEGLDIEMLKSLVREARDKEGRFHYNRSRRSIVLARSM